MEPAIQIKPHHFVDIVCDYGVDRHVLTPQSYGFALHVVTARVIAEPSAPLVMELGADDVCRPCCHNIAGRCDDTIDTTNRPAAPVSKQEYNLLIDQRWCEALHLGQGSSLTVAQFCELLSRPDLDLAGIYLEEPVEYAVDKQLLLQLGTRRLLGGD